MLTGYPLAGYSGMMEYGTCGEAGAAGGVRTMSFFSKKFSVLVSFFEEDTGLVGLSANRFLISVYAHQTSLLRIFFNLCASNFFVAHFF